MELNSYIDHTNLSVHATKEDIARLCQEAKDNHFAAVVVPPYYVSYASELLTESNVEVATVVGFPLGYATTEAKVYEAIDAVSKGATEIDMVINIAMLKNKDYDGVKAEIEEIRDSIDGVTLKVIIETCELTKEEKIKMVDICNATYVNFIKTSTGFGKAGATLEDVKLIMEHKNEVLEVKASGGIKTFEEATAFIDLGVKRIGTSHAMDMMKGE